MEQRKRQTEWLPKEITGPDLYLKHCGWLFPAQTSFISLAPIAVLSTQKQVGVYRAVAYKDKHCLCLCERECVCAYQCIFQCIYWIKKRGRRAAGRTCVSKDVGNTIYLDLSCDNCEETLSELRVSSNVLTICLSVCPTASLFSPCICAFIPLRNQAMRKKLILYFKRRNHARKQWVSRELIIFDSVGTQPMNDD